MKRGIALLFLIISINCLAQTKPVFVNLCQDGNTTVPVSEGGTGATTIPASRDSLRIKDYNIGCYQSGGSAMIAQNFPVDRITTNLPFTSTSNQTVTYQQVKLLSRDTIKGVQWYQSLKGIYNAANNNKVGLYKDSSGIAKFVASSINDTSLWKTGTTNSYRKEAFSTPYVADTGLYYVAYIYCITGTATTPPAMGGCPNVLNVAVYNIDLTMGRKFGAPFKTGQTDLPAMQDMSLTTGEIGNPWISVYK